MNEMAGWVAPVATMIAAMMTAANLGARVTGWGFIIFTIGSVAWSIVAISSGQQNLLWTNALLTLVNAVGIWRWLGRQARYEDGGQAATVRSATAPVPTLYAVSALVGGKLMGRDNEPIGTVIEGMMRCGDAGLAYIVVSEGGIAGVGERLHALHPDELKISEEGISSRLSLEELQRRDVLEPDHWPASFAQPLLVRGAAL
ncbi:PRC-barrel domain containing protein [Sphingobium sp. AN558]|uniref:PRC-barrel domain containing protein n=1 Tax=Sphingobium sp. AN558 TaxID=3133442 RepID=UPI0030C39A22